MASNGINPMQLIGMMMRSGNPQQFLMNISALSANTILARRNDYEEAKT